MAPKHNEESSNSFDHHALFYTIKSGNCKKVKDLLDKNCLVIDNKWIDYKLLIYAVKCQRQLPIVELLVEKGCRVRGPKTNQYKTPLYYAVEGKKTALLQFLLKAGASICDKDVNQDTPLYFALKENYFHAVDLMLSMYDVENIDPNSADEKIHFNIACMRNSVNLVKCFIEKGIDVNAVQNWFMKKWSGYTPLHFAVDFQQYETVKILLLHGAKVNCVDDQNSTPLHLAVKGDYQEIIKTLLEYGADTNLKNQESLSLLHLAVKNKSVDVVELLLNHGADFTKQDKNAMTPLHLAFDIDEADIKSKIVDLILKFHATNTANPVDNRKLSHFHISCTRNNIALVKAFLESGVNVNQLITLRNSHAGISPLHLAVDFQQKEIVKVLLLHGASVNSVDDQNSTALHLAVEGGYEAITKVLLEYGADANLKNQKSLTPLHLAVKNKLENIVKLLLENRANVNAADDQNSTPLQLAVKGDYQEIAKLLLEHGADTNLKYQENLTPLHLAVKKKLKNIVKLLLENRANVNAVDDQNLTPLQLAVKGGYQEIAKLLLEYGADANLKYQENLTPLHLAVKKKLKNIVKLLLLYEADPSIGDQQGISPIHIAYFDLPRSEEILNMMLSMYQCKLSNTSDTDNFSIFHIACILNKVEVVNEFLQENVNVDTSVKITAEKWPGFTPLHFAAYFYNYDLTQSLLQSKANVNLEEKNGYTPLWLAIKFRFNDDIANKLNKNILKNKTSYSDAGVDEDEVMNYLLKDIKQLEIIYALVSKSNLNHKDANGRPLLLEACFPEITWEFSDNIANKNFIMSVYSRFYDKNLKTTLKILIEHGIDLSVKDKNNVPILHHVADRYKCTKKKIVVILNICIVLITLFVSVYVFINYHCEFK